MRVPTAYPPNVEDPLSQFFSLDGRIGLLYGASPLTRYALYGIARAVISNHEVWVLDGANSFDAYFAARLARHWNFAPESILERIHLSRAFTCYQLSECITQRLPLALARSSREPFSNRANTHARCLHSHTPATIFLPGLLDTFYDDDVPMTDAVRLLRSAIASVREMARQGHTVFITARQPNGQPILRQKPAPVNERLALMELLKAGVTHLKRIEGVSDKPTLLPTQLTLIPARSAQGSA